MSAPSERAAREEALTAMTPSPAESVPAPEAHPEAAHFDPRPHKPSARGVALAGFLALVGLGGLALAGIAPRLRAAAASATQEAAQAAGGVERLAVAKMKRAKAGGELSLPGIVKPLDEAAIYARTNGYLRRYLVDIGDVVKEGDVLAEIDAPDLDQELAQARAASVAATAQRAQALAGLELARTTLKRTEALAAQGLASTQDLEEKQAALRAGEAGVAASDANIGVANANVGRLVELEKYEKVVAPFAGTITARTAEPGALIVSGAAGQPLFKLAETDPVRVFVQVPQLYAASIKVGAPATLTTRELRGRTFTGKITRTSRSLDPTAHTLNTETQFENHDGALLPGTYARVVLGSMAAETPLVVPATALIFNARGTQLAVVQDGVVHLRAVEVDGDFGDQVSIASGVREGESVVVVPTDRLEEGQRVETTEQKP